MLIHDFLHDAVVAIPTTVLVYGEQYPVFFHCFHHFIKFSYIQSGRLLIDDVFPCPSCLQRHFLVEMVWNRQQNRIYIRICQQGIHVFIKFIAFSFCILQFFRIYIADCLDFHSFNSWRIVFVPFPHAAISDDS
ncbi:hypothetical protein SDC9_163712 [bioreactor metagenome]|uniref:Uncharacterized protein n=1 Tax=bioreactor metagenome TaxID=1076179 RepID=A0A645FWQ7_9ZZZZ